MKLEKYDNEYLFQRSIADDICIESNNYYAWKQDNPVDRYVYNQDLIEFVGDITKNLGKAFNFSSDNYVKVNVQDQKVSFTLNTGESSDLEIFKAIQDDSSYTFLTASSLAINTDYDFLLEYSETVNSSTDEETGETIETTVYNYELKAKPSVDTEYVSINTFITETKGIELQLLNIGGYLDLEKSYINDVQLALEGVDTRKIYYTEKLGTDIINLIPDDEEVIGTFESVQAGNTYMFVYTESQTQGKLYTMDFGKRSLDVIIEGLSVTGFACATDFTQGWLDMFIFSNGEEIKYIYSDNETNLHLQMETTEKISLVDQEGRTVKGLGLVVFDSRLWVFDGKVLWYSQQGECRNFTYNDSAVITSAGYIEFVKDITAIYPYLGTLAVFHKDSSVLVTLDSTTGFKQSDESPGGCAGYNALVFHGTDLFFYDDTKKGVFSFQQVINGDKTLGNNIAFDIQTELMQIEKQHCSKIKALSVVTKDRNEVWFLVPISDDENYSIILIFDYIRGEWLKRKCQRINTIGIFESSLYSAGKQIYQEYNGENFDGAFIQSFYKCTVFNYDSDNTLKITKFPPRVTVEANEKCHFWVKYVKNYNPLKKPKVKEIKTKTNTQILYYDKGYCYDSGYIYPPKTLNSVVKLPSATFKAIEIMFYTEDSTHSFALKALEFSKLKVKQV